MPLFSHGSGSRGLDVPPTKFVLGKLSCTSRNTTMINVTSRMHRAVSLQGHLGNKSVIAALYQHQLS